MRTASITELAKFYETKEYEQAQEVIQRLYNCGFIHRDYSRQSKADYDFILDHKSLIELILDLNGFDLIVSEAEGRRFAFYSSKYSANRLKFKKDYTIVLLRCLYEFLSQMQKVSSSRTTSAKITCRELLDNVNALRGKGKMDIKTIREILYDMDRHQLISISGKKKDFGLDTNIQLLSSITCLVSSAELHDVTDKLQALTEQKEQSSSEGDGSEEEDGVFND